MTRVVFMGTPDFAVPALMRLIERPEFEVVGVITQPDRPAGRGQQVAKSAVKQAAEESSVRIFQPETLRDPVSVETVRGWQPDILVVVAFGQILRQPILEVAPFGCVNVHASLLPRWRGAAPIQYAIRAGDENTGVTIMKMDAGLDTGPILAQQSIPMAPDETGASLHDKLAEIGANLLPETLLGYMNGKIQPQPQSEMGATLAKTLKKDEGKIDWSQGSEVIDRQVRAFTPWPGTFTLLDGSYLKVHRGRAITGTPSPGSPGKVIERENELLVQTGDGLYLLEELQPTGKQRMSGRSFLTGHPNIIGKMLGS